MIYRFTIAPESAVGTPFRSDTLFGHACWTVKMYYDAKRFDEFLNGAAAQKPELVFSDGFPSGWLPKPLFPKTQNIQCTKDDYPKVKKKLKRLWVRYEDIGNFFSETYLKNDEKDSKEYSDQPKEQAVLHNVIDRMTGTSLSENGLYSQEKSWYGGIWENVDIYVSTEWDRENVDNFLKKMFEIGYGRDQTVGMGKIAISKSPQKVTFPQSETDLYLSLSRAVPCDNAVLKESFYKIETKYGKVWNGLENQKSPFKKPVIQTVPGSVFKMKKNVEKAGVVLKDVHDNEKVIENCMTILYPLSSKFVKGVLNETAV